MNTQRFSLKNSQGYTLIEVTLFLALSAMLSFIAFAGLGPRMRNVRFTSGMRTINDTIGKQFANLDTGLNVGSDGFSCVKQGDQPAIIQNLDGSGITGGSQDCVINGRAFFLDQGKMTVYYITSLREMKSGCNPAADPDVDQNLQRLLCYSPHAFNTAFGTQRRPDPLNYTYPGGITFKGSVDSLAAIDGSQAFGYIVDPGTNAKYQFVYGKTHSGNFANGNSNPGSWGGVTPFGPQDLVLNQVKSYCFGLSSRYASITISPNSDTPSLIFEDSRCPN